VIRETSDKLCLALSLAAQAHKSQTDKQGQPYILHILRVVLSQRLETDTERALAAVHDIKEDNSNYWNIVQTYFDDEFLDAVDAISRQPDEPYFDYIKRCRENTLARRVKLADLDDNISRLILLPLEESRRLGDRYRRAYTMLTLQEMK